MVTLIFYLRLGPVNQEEFFGGAGEGGVEPVDIVGGKHIIGHVTLVYVNVRPLTTLGLVTSNGISIFYLESVIVLIALQFFYALNFLWHISIIFHNSIV